MIKEDPKSTARYLVDSFSELTPTVLLNYPDGVTFNVKGDKSYYLDNGVLRSAGGDASARILTIPFYSGTVTLTNMAAADSELPTTQYRLLLDLLGFTQFRATMRVATAGSTNSDLRFQYSLNDSVFTNLDGSAGPELPIATTGSKDTGWVGINSLARVNNVYIRMMGKEGDGVADPVLRQIMLHFK